MSGWIYDNVERCKHCGTCATGLGKHCLVCKKEWRVSKQKKKDK